MGNKPSSRLKENDYDNGNVTPSKHGAKKAKSASKPSKSTVKGGRKYKGKKKKDRKKNTPSTPLLTLDKTEDAPFSPMSCFIDDGGMQPSLSPISTTLTSSSTSDDERTKDTLNHHSSFGSCCEDSQQTTSPNGGFVNHLDVVNLDPLASNMADSSLADEDAIIPGRSSSQHSSYNDTSEDQKKTKQATVTRSVSPLNLFPEPESTMSSHQDMSLSPPIPTRLSYAHEMENNRPEIHGTNSLGGGVKEGDNDQESISSLLSTSYSPSIYSLSTYSTDLESIGKFSTDGSLSDLSLSSSIASLNLKRKKRRSPRRPQLQNSRLGSSKQRLSGTKNKRRNCTDRPMAHNAFETLPRHLIKSALVRQATSTLRDERFVRRRILKLGPVPAAKIHVSDLLYLQKREEKDCQRRETQGVEASVPDSSLFWDNDCAMSVTLESFDLFLKCLLELCSVRMVNLAVDCELTKGDAAACGNIRPSSAEKKKSKVPAVAILDAGKAIFLLGKCVHKKEWNEEAIEYYRSALFLFLTELGIREPCLLDESGDCAGFFYARIANAGVDVYSTTHKHIATLLTKMGDIHGKSNEINDALHSYRASQVFWQKYLSVNDSESVADMADLDDHAAAVEGLALTHNRIGGVYCSKGNLESALNSFNKAIEMQLEALGPDHLEVAKTLHNIGVSHRHKKDLVQALEYYHKALRIFELNLGKEHLDTVRTLHNIGGVFRRQKKYAEAMSCFRDVLKVRRTLLGDSHPSVSITLVSIAAVLRRSGKADEANAYYSEAMK